MASTKTAVFEVRAVSSLCFLTVAKGHLPRSRFPRSASPPPRRQAARALAAFLRSPWAASECFVRSRFVFPWRQGKTAPSRLTAPFSPAGGDGIRIVGVKVPKVLLVGGEGDLECRWETESDQMYSIKWYQDAHEFYRYTATSADPVQIFDPPTLDVDVSLGRRWAGGIVRGMLW